jgi:hypothetical protein
VAAGYERLGIEDSIPDTTTLWLYREKLAKAGLIEELFELRRAHHPENSRSSRVRRQLAAKNLIVRGALLIFLVRSGAARWRFAAQHDWAVRLRARCEGGIDREGEGLLPVRCPPTALSLSLIKGLRHVPLAALGQGPCAIDIRYMSPPEWGSSSDPG